MLGLSGGNADLDDLVVRRGVARRIFPRHVTSAPEEAQEAAACVSPRAGDVKVLKIAVEGTLEQHFLVGAVELRDVDAGRQIRRHSSGPGTDLRPKPLAARSDVIVADADLRRIDPCVKTAR